MRHVRSVWVALKAASPVLLLVLAVFGGLYSGIFTVTEAASISAVVAGAALGTSARSSRCLTGIEMVAR